MDRRTVLVCCVVMSAVLNAAVAAWTQPAASVWDGVYTDAQAARGATLYERECGQCHGPGGAGGGMAPALVGASFSANYDGQTVGDLFDRNRTTMPPGKEGQLSARDNADITAYVLKVNQFPAGQTELPSQGMALKGIAYLAVRPQQPGESPSPVRRDDTTGYEWITRLERPERVPALKTREVIAALGLRPGMTIADIGSGTGAFTIPFAAAVSPGGTAFAVDIWPELLDYVQEKAARERTTTLKTVLAQRDDPLLPPGSVDIVFFHDVFHNVHDRPGYLGKVATALKPGGRIAIIEQEFDDPIAKQWDRQEDRITPDQLRHWMATVGFEPVHEFDLFQGANNPKGAGMPERWFVVYQRSARRTPQTP